MFFGNNFDNFTPNKGGMITNKNKLKIDLKVWNCQNEVHSAAYLTKESWKANKNPPLINKTTLWYWLLLKVIFIFPQKKMKMKICKPSYYY